MPLRKTQTPIPFDTKSPVNEDVDGRFVLRSTWMQRVAEEEARKTNGSPIR